MSADRTTLFQLLRLMTSARLLVAPVVALALVLAGGCAGGSSSPDPTATVSAADSRPSPTAARIATPETPTPEPTVQRAIDALLDPGPTFPSPTRVFFRNGAELWQLTAGQAPQPVVTGVQLGPFAPAPDGSRVAVTVRSRSGGVDRQEVWIVAGEGGTQAVALEPQPAQPAITSLAWSWDGAWLAIGWADGGLALTPAGPAVGSTIPLGQGPLRASPVGISWALNDAGVAWLSESDAGQSLVVTPREGEGVVVADAAASPAHPIRSFAWLPGRGRIAYVEGAADATGTPSSIFTTAPDASSRELLVSSGRFGPVVYFDHLVASPDGRLLAFTVYLPNAEGSPVFAAMWVLHIDSGELEQVSVPEGYRVTDLWWIDIGLVWRGADAAVRDGDLATEYAGSEPFILSIYSFDSKSSSIVFQSTSETGIGT